MRGFIQLQKSVLDSYSPSETKLQTRCLGLSTCGPTARDAVCLLRMASTQVYGKHECNLTLSTFSICIQQPDSLIGHSLTMCQYVAAAPKDRLAGFEKTQKTEITSMTRNTTQKDD